MTFKESQKRYRTFFTKFMVTKIVILPGLKITEAISKTFFRNPSTIAANGLLSRLMSAIGDLLSAIRYCVTE